MKLTLDDLSGVVVGLIFLVLILALLPSYMAACVEGFWGRDIPDNFTLQTTAKSREDLNRGYVRKMQGVDGEEAGAAPELAAARPYAKCGVRVVEPVGEGDVVAGSGVVSVAAATPEERTAEMERGDLLRVARGEGVVDVSEVMRRLPAGHPAKTHCGVHGSLDGMALCLMEEGAITRGEQERQVIQRNMPRVFGDVGVAGVAETIATGYE